MTQWITVLIRPGPHHRKDLPAPAAILGRLPTTLRVHHVPVFRGKGWKACRVRFLWQVHPEDIALVTRARGGKYEPGRVFYVCGHQIVAP